MDFQQLADVADKWCSNTPFELIATEETERRMDFYADPGVSFYVLCPDNGCGDNFVSAGGRAREGGQPERTCRGGGRKGSFVVCVCVGWGAAFCVFLEIEIIVLGREEGSLPRPASRNGRAHPPLPLGGQGRQPPAPEPFGMVSRPFWP